MTAYYNEHEPYAAQWLRTLIAAVFIRAARAATWEVNRGERDHASVACRDQSAP